MIVNHDTLAEQTSTLSMHIPQGNYLPLRRGFHSLKPLLTPPPNTSSTWSSYVVLSIWRLAQ